MKYSKKGMMAEDRDTGAQSLVVANL